MNALPKRACDDANFLNFQTKHLPSVLAHAYATGRSKENAENSLRKEFERQGKVAKRAVPRPLNYVIEAVVASQETPTHEQISTVIAQQLAHNDFFQAFRHVAYCMSLGGLPFETLPGRAPPVHDLMNCNVSGRDKHRFDELCTFLPHLHALTVARIDAIMVGDPLRPLFLKYPNIWFYAAVDQAAVREWAHTFYVDDIDPSCLELEAVCYKIMDIPGAEEAFVRAL